MELDALGGAATGGLVGAAVSSPTGRAGTHQPHCADCGTETLGRFCHNCGNPSHVHRTLLHLGEELLHGVMHFDSRTWRTLPLLVFRPGKLTREWVEGKRARYVSPLALFLFTIFVLFMVLSYAPISPVEPIGTLRADEHAGAAAQHAIGALQAEGRASADAQRTTILALERALAAAPQADRAKLSARVVAARARLAGSVKDGVDLRQIDEAVGGDWKAQLAAIAKADKLRLDTGDKRLNETIRHKLENPDLAIYKLQQTFYKFSFLLVPISIPFVALLFLWRRDVTLYDHGVFILYSLTFMSVLAMTAAEADRVGGGVTPVILAATPFIVPLHMFSQLRSAYGLTLFGAAWRTLILLMFCAVALTLFVLAILWLGLA